MFATLDGDLFLEFTTSAFHSQDNLLGSLSLLLEDRLCLTTKTLLFTIVSSLTLGEKRGFTGLVLGYFVELVTFA